METRPIPSTVLTICELMPKLMADCKAVGKDHKNSFHKYQYRSVDDLMSAVREVLIKHSVFLLPRFQEPTYTHSEKSTHCRVLLELDWVASDGSRVTTTSLGEGTDTGDKAAYKAMAGALKYNLLQTLEIPTDEPKDPEYHK